MLEPDQTCMIREKEGRESPRNYHSQEELKEAWKMSRGILEGLLGQKRLFDKN